MQTCVRRSPWVGWRGDFRVPVSAPCLTKASRAGGMGTRSSGYRDNPSRTTLLACLIAARGVTGSAATPEGTTQYLC